MSFFERMMLLNQPSHLSHPNIRQSIYNQEETSAHPPQHQMHPQKKSSKILRQSMKSSLSLKVEDFDQEQGWEDIADEPSVLPPRRQPKPHLLHHLLPRKEQMIREMVEKKREFQLRKISLCSEQKGVRLECKVRQEFIRFKKSELHSVKDENSSRKKPQKMKASSVKDYSSKKIKPILTFDESVYSASPNTQMVASPVAPSDSFNRQVMPKLPNTQMVAPSDRFNRQVMLKLLNIIEKDRVSASVSQQSVPQKEASPRKQQKDAPIIINNIMKTPAEGIDRGLIEREMKIRMLENHRHQRQLWRETSEKPTSKPGDTVPQTINLDPNTEEPIFTQRTNRQSLDSFSVTTKHNNRASAVKKPDKQVKQLGHQEVVLQQITFQNQSISNCSSEQRQKLQSTKHSSSVNSRVTDPLQNKQAGKRVRDFKKNSKAKQKPELENEAPVVKRQPIKPPVKIQIPLEGQSQMEGMTLAEAFKKRVGRLKSEQRRQQKVSDASPNPTGASDMQSPPSNMAITITDKFTQYSSQFDCSVPATSKNTTISLIDPATQRSAVIKKKQSQNPMKKYSKQEGSTHKKATEPSKQLMDRLIYGERAKISKEEMLTLTKKNYANLPEVQAKRKEEEKRKVEQQRKSKVKEYQKAIRSGKSLRT